MTLSKAHAYRITGNNITGELLMEMDQNHLKEIGIKKIGDRVRIGSQVKLFRSREFRRPSKKAINRVRDADVVFPSPCCVDLIKDSLAMLDNPVYTPPSGSPRPLHSARSYPTPRADKRMSRQFNASDMNFTAIPTSVAKSSSRPDSPLVDHDGKSQRSQRQAAVSSPKDHYKRDQSSTNPNSATLRHQQTVMDVPPSARSFGQSRHGNGPAETPQTARFPVHLRASPSFDMTMTNSSILPPDLIRVIYDNARSSVVSIDGCKSAEDVIFRTLRKGNLNETHVKNHCFYVLDGLEPNPAACRRLPDYELLRICTKGNGAERGRLILRKIHSGEPEEDQLRTAAGIALQQVQQEQSFKVPVNELNRKKVEKLTGEPLPAISYPLSPASQQHLEREEPRLVTNTPAHRARKLKEFYGARPPSELIASDLITYFPDVQKEEIEKTVRMSVRRSIRMSKATSRLSIASNYSISSSLKDAPPLPTIADSWLHNTNQPRVPRPLSVLRLGVPSQNARSSMTYRDSVTSSVLEPLEEESPADANRRSYTSIGGESLYDIRSTTDSDSQSTQRSYFDDTGSSPAGTENGDSLNKRLSQALAEDGEEYDEELTEYLENDTWENMKYMKGALIGQGSFGSVYLALHAVTGELMAVKQVEMPSSSGTQLDAKKNNMIEALKREISLLRELKHPNIVQYLGSNSDDTHLHIFLEYVPGGSVASMLVNYGPLGEGLIKNFVRQILTGLAYLHSKDIIHRDIKGANILVDNKGSVKISDFGISKRVEASSFLSPTGGKKAGQRVSLQGSVFWMAPEVVKQTAYTRKADIWSLGCLIVEMFTGTHPHPNCTQLQAIFKIGGSGDATPTIPDICSEDARTFLRRTFELDHEKRPVADELLLSSFVNVRT